MLLTPKISYASESTYALSEKKKEFDLDGIRKSLSEIPENMHSQEQKNLDTFLSGAFAAEYPFHGDWHDKQDYYLKDSTTLAQICHAIKPELVGYLLDVIKYDRYGVAERAHKVSYRRGYHGNTVQDKESLTPFTEETFKQAESVLMENPDNASLSATTVKKFFACQQECIRNKKMSLQDKESARIQALSNDIQHLLEGHVHANIAPEIIVGKDIPQEKKKKNLSKLIDKVLKR